MRLDLLPPNQRTAEAAAARDIAIVTSDPPLAERRQETDIELVLRARSGDLTAYSELVSRHQRAVYGIVSRMVASREDVDDLVQDVFVLAYRSLDGFRGQAGFATWIHRIAVNTTIKHLRKAKSGQAVSIDDPEAGLENNLIAETDQGPFDAVHEGERKEAVRRAVKELPEKHRLVVILHYFEDYTCEEIAKILDCSVGTVWSRLHYACRTLRGQLDWLETA